jgi:Outer membrane protein beta-barrel domain
MKEKSTLENLFKTELNKKEFEYSEKLWQKLDNQLMPVRDAYYKKERRRIVFFFSIAAILIGGTTTFFAVGNNNSKQKITTTTVSTQENKKEVSDDKGRDLTALQDLTKNIDLPNISNGNTTVIGTGNSSKETAAPTNNSSLYNSNSNNLQRSSIAKRTSVAKAPKAKKLLEEVPPSTLEEEVVEGTKEPTEAIPPVEDNVVAPVEEKKVAPKTEDKNVATPAALKKKVEPTGKSSFFALAGINATTPVKKQGYYVGAMMEKQIDSKRRIFVGVKLAQNKLHHQLINSEKATIFPQVTDAVIERMTTIQMPFGYQFRLNKKQQEKATLFSVGFEPTLLTGVRTTYYDDNGVPNGPRTPVVNSPLLKNAVNKFNISFIAGIKVPLTSRIGFSLNMGYGLIDITDKQYYNRTSTNNNLKYVQTGLLFRLK